MKRLHFGMLLEFLEALSTLTVVLLLTFGVGLFRSGSMP